MLPICFASNRSDEIRAVVLPDQNGSRGDPRSFELVRLSPDWGYVLTDVA